MKIIVIDCNYICHAVYHSVPVLSHNNNHTQIIYGFIKRIFDFSRRFTPNNIVFTWDSIYSIRKVVYSSYKKERAKKGKDEKTEAEKRSKRQALRQFDEIKLNSLFELGFTNVFHQNGYEADDIMASVVNSNNGYDFIVVTTDKDLYQIISDNCSLYNPVTNSLRTVRVFQDEYGCHPSLWGEARSISGCSTDEIEGVKGVGEKTAIKYLLGSLNPKTKKYKDIKAAGDQLILNRELIKLPMYGTKPIKIKSNNELNRKKFIKLCEKHNFKSFLTPKNLDRWDKVIA